MADIKRRSKVKCPDKLYKYFGNTKYALMSIKKETVHLDEVESFNDPFECYNESFYISDPNYFGLIRFIVNKNNLVERDHDLSNEELKEAVKKSLNFDIYNEIIKCLKTDRSFMNHICSDFAFDESKWDLFMYLSDEIQKRTEPLKRIKKEIVVDYFCNKWSLLNYRNMILQELTVDRSGKIKKQDKGLKVSCFSEKNDSILMWSYYGNSHKGICVEYDFTDEENKNKMCKVLYRNERVFTSDNWFRLKALCWNREKEWRLSQIPPVSEPKIKIKNIYFGVRFDYANDEYYQQIVSCAESRGVGLYKTILNNEKYEVEFYPLYS
ncbi:MAG: DUF2971 domain-containing protein [Hespellia sp.]|nr:DUF2971 domain-containing protein [Hespellia sp.]